jgi:hypothetical protein
MLEGMAGELEGCSKGVHLLFVDKFCENFEE